MPSHGEASNAFESVHGSRWRRPRSPVRSHDSFSRLEMRDPSGDQPLSICASDSALVLAERALELDPEEPAVHLALGFVYENNGWSQRATEEALRTLELNPNEARATNGVGASHMEAGRLDEAIPWEHDGLHAPRNQLELALVRCTVQRPVFAAFDLGREPRRR